MDILQKEETLVLELGTLSCREKRGTNLFEVFHVNVVLYCFSSPALSSPRSFFPAEAP